MKKQKRVEHTLVALVLVVGAVLSWTYATILHGRIPGTCVSVPKQAFENGTQGYRIWANDDLASFNHNGKRICIPEGFEAIGERESGTGYALFKSGVTGIVIRSDAFSRETLYPSESGYEISFIYPLDTPQEFIEKYRAIVKNAFSRVAGLYDSEDGELETHTVLVTALLGGNTIEEGTRVYPDPSEDLTIVVRTPDQPRSEELVIHAVAHVFNRYREDLGAYKKNQLPFAPEDFEELEATWTETAFLTWEEARIARLQYLHRIHVAVRNRDFSLITTPPFNDEEAFNEITESVIVPRNASYLNHQYNHYVLAPLGMVAIEGLFSRALRSDGVEEVLQELHANPSLNFLEVLEEKLGQDARVRIEGFLLGHETIPFDLVLEGAKRYARTP
jgi:hypothetical protein